MHLVGKNGQNRCDFCGLIIEVDNLSCLFLKVLPAAFASLIENLKRNKGCRKKHIPKSNL